MPSMDRCQSQQAQLIRSHERTHSSSYVCQLHDQIILRPACKCSQRALTPACATAEWRGPEVVQWSQHSKIFVWVRHCLMCFCCCALNVWWGTRQKTGRNRKEQQVLWVAFPKSDRSLLSRKLGILEDTVE